MKSAKPHADWFAPPVLPQRNQYIACQYVRVIFYRARRRKRRASQRNSAWQSQIGGKKKSRSLFGPLVTEPCSEYI
jgi:hypothetical protein